MIKSDSTDLIMSSVYGLRSSSATPPTDVGRLRSRPSFDYVDSTAVGTRLLSARKSIKFHERKKYIVNGFRVTSDLVKL